MDESVLKHVDMDMNPDELYHYGRKGMKWGQNIFGKISDRRKANKRKKQLAKAREAREKRQEALKSNKISIKDMSDAELKKRLDRLRLERDTLQAERDTITFQQSINELTAPKKKKGENFLKKFADGAVAPALTDAGKELLTKYLKKTGAKVLGVDDKTVDTVAEKLKKQAEKAGWEKAIADAEVAKRKNRKEAKNEEAENRAEKEAQEVAAEAAKRNKQAEKEAAKAAKQAEKWAETNKSAGKEYADRIIVDDYTVDDFSSSTTSAGRSYVSELLALPAPKDED